MHNNNLKKRSIRVIALTLIITLALGMVSTFAVSKPGKPKITSLSKNYNMVTVKWSKVNNASGYDLYRNGKKIVRTTSRSNKNTVSVSGKYTYKVRAYKKYKVNQKQYYNKKKGKWQTKKIKGAKKRTNKVTKYKYGKYSSAKSISVTVQKVDLVSLRSSMLVLINEERAKASLEPLELDDTLNITAQAKAKDLFTTGEFDHYSRNLGWVNDQLDSVGYSYDFCAENIAEGQTSVVEVMYDWMHSAGHKANILDEDFTVVGIGYYNGEWVQQFAHPAESDMGIIPDVVGMTEKAAKAAFEKNGFINFSVTYEYSDTVAEGKVISQGPPFVGYLFNKNNTIELVVSLGVEK